MNEIKVMIIDDEEMLRSNLADYLEDEGFRVDTFSSGEQALEAIKNGNKYHVAIVDLRLPGMNGNDFIIESRDLANEIFILIHTGSSDYQLSPEMVEMGITPKQIIYKPIYDMSIFTEAILKHSDKH
ncbi:MAG: response regulator [Candidatus Kapaibacterium sp.]